MTDTGELKNLFEQHARDDDLRFARLEELLRTRLSAPSPERELGMMNAQLKTLAEGQNRIEKQLCHYGDNFSAHETENVTDFKEVRDSVATLRGDIKSYGGGLALAAILTALAVQIIHILWR